MNFKKILPIVFVHLGIFAQGNLEKLKNSIKANDITEVQSLLQMQSKILSLNLSETQKSELKILAQKNVEGQLSLEEKVTINRSRNGKIAQAGIFLGAVLGLKGLREIWRKNYHTFYSMRIRNNDGDRVFGYRVTSSIPNGLLWLSGAALLAFISNEFRKNLVVQKCSGQLANALHIKYLLENNLRS